MKVTKLVMGVRVTAAFTLALCLSLNVAEYVSAAPAVCLITDAEPGPATRHGLSKVVEALEGKGTNVRRGGPAESADGATLIVSGLGTAGGRAARLLEQTGAKIAEKPGSLLVRHMQIAGRTGLLVVGSDDRGLMYALLDVADRIRWAADPERPLSEVQDTAETPFVSDRALSIYTMHQACFEERFFDKSYWARYFDMLAANRFNRFVLIFGYENWGYFSPPYPYFFDVEGFPQVRVVGITPEKQRRNLRALNRMIEMAHERGLEFTVGIWDHIYRGGVQGPKDRAEKPTEGIVWGLDQDNLVPYTKRALAKFLKRVPDIDSIQFRMHGESGLRRQEMEGFWTDVYRIMKAHRPDMRFDARAKNFPDSLIDRAIEIGVPIRICTKYWMEQMGLPFHPTHIHPNNQFDRRHGYADLLRYPKRYDVHWRLWNAGTTRVLLWSDPEYVRRFAESTHLYGGQGFEVNEPMGTKMQDHPHDLPPFELMRPEYRYYDWEFERYWYFYRVFGRVSYNPDTPGEVLRRGFERRFGSKAAVAVQEALHRASQILPRTVAYCYPYRRFPTTRGWVERQRQEDLPVYAKSLPSDTEQFLSMEQAAQCVLDGEDSAKIWPAESADWFAQASKDVLRLVEQAEAAFEDEPNKEFASTLVDLRILAHLAAYHSHRARAGFQWALFDRSEDVSALDKAIAEETKAVAAWARIVEAAGDVYHDDLMMGRRSADLSGHWRDELVKLEAGLDALKRERAQYRPKGPADRLSVAHVPVRKAAPNQPVIVSCTVAGLDDHGAVTLVHGNPDRGLQSVRMEKSAPLVYAAEIRAGRLSEGLAYFITATDAAGEEIVWPRAGRRRPHVVLVADDNVPPTVKHSPLDSAPASKPLTIKAIVQDPSGVKWVRLRYRGVCQHFDYKTLRMEPTDRDEYQATVPAEDVAPEWDFMYFIEVMDNAGNGAIYPDLDKQTPYVVVRLER